MATESRFQDCLDQSAGDLNDPYVTRTGALLPRVLVSNLCCCGAVARCVQQRLEKYQGPRRVLARWREHAEMLLGPQGHCLFADSLLAARVPIKKHCEAWALEESSQYVLEAMRHAVRACQEHLGDKAALRTYLLTTLLPWAGWPVQDFHTAVGTTILHPITAREPGTPRSADKARSAGYPPRGSTLTQEYEKLARDTGGTPAVAPVAVAR